MTTSNKWKVGIIGTLVLICACSIAGILAYYNQTRELDNVMKTQSSEVYLLEIFNENDNWVVGETKEKVVSFGNSGETAQVIRISYEAVWLEPIADENGTITWTAWAEAEESAVDINWTAAFASNDSVESQWTLIDGYYYYNYVLEPGAVTDIVMDSITYSSEITNGGYDLALDYSNKQYSLTFQLEALSVNNMYTTESWYVEFTIGTDDTLSWSTVTTPLIIDQ